MHVVDLEEKLSADASGALRDEIVAALSADRMAIRRRIDSGLSPDDFRVAQAFYDACVAAERVTTDYWKRAHMGARPGEMPPI